MSQQASFITVQIAFTLPLLRCNDKDTFELDWSEPGEGRPLPNRYLFHVGERIECPKDPMKLMVHVRNNALRQYIVQPSAKHIIAALEAGRIVLV